MDSSSPKPKSRLKAVVLDVRSGLAAFSNANDAQQRTYLAGLLCRESTALAEQCLKRNHWLNTAYDWIEEHKDELDAEDLKAREERWILALRQYEHAMDLLGQVLEILKETAKPAQHHTASTSTTAHTQKAFP